eukprot:TRINITY_DN13845_c0_g1_i2.p3 TRINITY_DN13845_c0_g1~~TRINITY_DN13845_c0_g1_i2.p3  ORF type:complete len:329 (-),score=82.01 TRINITY_DN13845_c0_g1_i2:884-1870(-)
MFALLTLLFLRGLSQFPSPFVARYVADCVPRSMNTISMCCRMCPGPNTSVAKHQASCICAASQDAYFFVLKDMLGLTDLMGKRQAARQGSDLQDPPKVKKTNTKTEDCEDVEDVEAMDIGELAKDTDIRKVLKLLCTISLSHDYHINVLRSVCIESVLIPRSTTLVDRCKATTKAFHDKVMALAKEKRAALGSPHILVWEQMLEFFVAEMNGKEKYRKHLDNVTALVDETKGTGSPIEHLCDIIRHCRIAKCHRKDLARVEIGLKFNAAAITETKLAHPAWESMKAYLVAEHKGSYRPGIPPKGDLIRKLEKQVKRMTKGSEADRHDW